MRREQDRKWAVEALGLKHADMIVGRTKRQKKRKPENEKKVKDREKAKQKKEWGYQTSLKRKLPECITFVWSCRVMHLLLNIARVVERVVAELGSKGLEAGLTLWQLVLRGRPGGCEGGGKADGGGV
jgi:hypothetical protein